MSTLTKYDHLKIPLQDIKKATRNFESSTFIGKGGFGNVYKGELEHSGRQVIIAAKRLNPKLEQGNIEFMQELMILSRYRHANLVSLIGFSNEGGENILVYEYLPNESLDMHLENPYLSWIRRLTICIGAARGVEHLHNPCGTTMQRVVHRDLKSANILLDMDLNAKISDFGLSKFGPVNKEGSFLMSSPAGTLGYCDPYYCSTGILTKESDIYSFGVVLFEVLCGRAAWVKSFNDDRQFLSKLARRRYEEKKIDTIVLHSLQEQISQCCLEKFTKLAYRCLESNPKERPSITEIVKVLKSILRCQTVHDALKEKKLNSHSLFQLIENPKTKIFMENQWLDLKKRLM